MVAKSSKEFKTVIRGDYKTHPYRYVDENGKQKTYGLVCWKDRDMAYALTNANSTEGNGQYFQRSSSGRQLLTCPAVIDDYNEH